MKKYLLAGGLSFGIIGAALAGGLYNNLFPGVTAPTVNGSAVCSTTGATGLTGGFTCSTAVPTLDQLMPDYTAARLAVVGQSAPMAVAVDTNLTGGTAPQTVQATPFQIAALYASAALNTATSTVHAATLNTQGGVITTESLSTAAGATYTFTLTDSQIAAGMTIQVAMYGGTNTGGEITLTSVTAAAGSATFVWTNTGTTAFNGTMAIVFHI